MPVSLPKRKMSSERAVKRSRKREEKRARPQSKNARGGLPNVVVKLAIVALALLFAVIPAVFVGGPIGWMGLFAVVFAIVVSWGYLQLLRRSLSFDEGARSTTCTRGEEVEFSVTFRNSGPFVFTRIEPYFYVSDLFGGFDTVTPARMMLMPREESIYRFQARFTHVGTYYAGVSKVVVSDLLGLFTATIVNERRHPVHVAPRLFDIGKVPLENVSLRESRTVFQPIVTDDMDYAGVREYRFGDPLKTVHWNLSSRDPHERLFTRLFEVSAEPGLAVIIDPYAPSYGAEELRGTFDALVEAAASVSAEARRQGVDTEVRFLDTQGAPATLHLSRMSDIDDLVEKMLAVERADNVVLADEPVAMLEREARSGNGRDNVAYCTSRLEEDVLQMLLSLRLHRRNPMLFFALPRSLSDDERKEATRPLKRLSAAGISHFVVDSNEVATEVRSR